MYCRTTMDDKRLLILPLQPFFHFYPFNSLCIKLHEKVLSSIFKFVSISFPLGLRSKMKISINLYYSELQTLAYPHLTNGGSIDSSKELWSDHREETQKMEKAAASQGCSLHSLLRSKVKPNILDYFLFLQQKIGQEWEVVQEITVSLYRVMQI